MTQARRQLGTWLVSMLGGVTIVLGLGAAAPGASVATAPAPVDPFPGGSADVPHWREFRFSTEVGFTSAAYPGFLPISDGALLSDRRCLLLTNQVLTAQFVIMPPVPDLGLDAATQTFRQPVLFSLEQGIFSGTAGWLGHGDLLSTDGEVVRRNRDLIAAFQPIGPCPCDADTGTCTCDCTYDDCPCGCCNVGLDAVHVGPVSSADIGILFSVEHDFYSAALGQWVRHGDLLSEAGYIYRSHSELLANFHPVCPDCPDADCACDFGLDAVYVTPHGTVWFSVEEGFYDLRLGWVEDGSVLSENGRVLRLNRDLMHQCDPLEDLGDFGLDALDFRRFYLEPTCDSVEPVEIEPR